MKEKIKQTLVAVFPVPLCLVLSVISAIINFHASRNYVIYFLWPWMIISFILMGVLLAVLAPLLSRRTFAVPFLIGSVSLIAYSVVCYFFLWSYFFDAYTYILLGFYLFGTIKCFLQGRKTEQ